MTNSDSIQTNGVTPSGRSGDNVFRAIIRLVVVVFSCVILLISLYLTQIYIQADRISHKLSELRADAVFLKALHVYEDVSSATKQMSVDREFSGIESEGYFKEVEEASQLSHELYLYELLSCSVYEKYQSSGLSALKLFIPTPIDVKKSRNDSKGSASLGDKLVNCTDKDAPVPTERSQIPTQANTNTIKSIASIAANHKKLQGIGRKVGQPLRLTDVSLIPVSDNQKGLEAEYKDVKLGTNFKSYRNPASKKLGNLYLDTSYFFQDLGFIVPNPLSNDYVSDDIEKCEEIQDVLGAWILPPLYGFLGALVYHIRLFMNNEPKRIRVDDVLLRFTLGIMAGSSVTWLANLNLTGVQTSGNSHLLILGVAFLLGFSSDLFFSIADSGIRNIQNVLSRVSEVS